MTKEYEERKLITRDGKEMRVFRSRLSRHLHVVLILLDDSPFS